jgi:hypothetical protein
MNGGFWPLLRRIADRFKFGQKATLPEILQFSRDRTFNEPAHQRRLTCHSQSCAS